MRTMIWNTETQAYECNACQWEQAICTNCSDPAERLELDFSLHRCEEYRERAAA